MWEYKFSVNASGLKILYLSYSLYVRNFAWVRRLLIQVGSRFYC